MAEALKKMCPHCGGIVHLEQCQWCYEFDVELKQFCEQLCREQRRICKNEFDRRGVISEEDVRSGEMPEL